MTFGFLVFKKEFEDSKWIIRIHISKDRQYNGKTKKDKRTNNNLQNTTNKTKDRATRTTLNSGGELRCSGMLISSCSTSDTRRVNLVTMMSHERGKDREELTTSGTYP